VQDYAAHLGRPNSDLAGLLVQAISKLLRFVPIRCR
jgi:hypothetical protein